MKTCAGCGAPLAPTWKFCVHCGMAVEEPDIPAAIRPDAVASPAAPVQRRALLFGGIGIFLVGIALLVAAAIFVTGAFR
ncbi:MAG: zinc ribbon domain-containing protein [Galbitalea sp.]